jgi:hypothetical protein
MQDLMVRVVAAAELAASVPKAAAGLLQVVVLV